jgi:hypothetical protein
LIAALRGGLGRGAAYQYIVNNISKTIDSRIDSRKKVIDGGITILGGKVENGERSGTYSKVTCLIVDYCVRSLTW